MRTNNRLINSSFVSRYTGFTKAQMSVLFFSVGVLIPVTGVGATTVWIYKTASTQKKAARISAIKDR